mmetsp:Transcript_135395/g.306343  ORF Transcript_135395/g.306343 Transcript_135395/m.306343 type:complete len:244 (+) Transcript_135395:444-1175(+)
MDPPASNAAILCTAPAADATPSAVRLRTTCPTSAPASSSSRTTSTLLVEAASIKGVQSPRESTSRTPGSETTTRRAWSTAPPAATRSQRTASAISARISSSASRMPGSSGTGKAEVPARRINTLPRSVRSAMAAGSILQNSSCCKARNNGAQGSWTRIVALGSGSSPPRTTGSSAQSTAHVIETVPAKAAVNTSYKHHSRPKHPASSSTTATKPGIPRIRRCVTRAGSPKLTSAGLLARAQRK